jgi:hypothetical protein
MFGLDKAATRIVQIGTLVAVLIFLGLTLAYCQSRREAAVARSEAKVATGAANAGNAAVGATEGRYRRDAATDAQTKSNADFIEGAANSRDEAGEAGRRGVVAWCRRLQARGINDEPRCASI